MEPLNLNELIEINGGSDPDGCAGCAAGSAFREWLSDIWDSLGDVDWVNSPVHGPNGRSAY